MLLELEPKQLDFLETNMKTTKTSELERSKKPKTPKQSKQTRMKQETQDIRTKQKANQKTNDSKPRSATP